MCSIRRWFHLVSLIALFTASAAVQAVTVTAVKVNSGTGAIYDATVRSAPTPQWPAVIPKHHNLPAVPMSKNTLGKLAKGAIRGPAGFAVTAAMVGADWYFNQETGEFEKQTEETTQDFFWAAYNNQGYDKASTDIGSCEKHATRQTNSSAGTNNPVIYTCGSVLATGTSPTWTRFQIDQAKPDGTPLNGTTYTARKYGGTYVVEPYTITADEEDYANAVEVAAGTGAGNNVAVQVANNAISNSTPSQLAQDWPELASAMNNLAQSIQAAQAHLNDPVANPAPTEEQQQDAEGIGGSGHDLPPFCTWASFLCEPFVATPHPEVPTVDIEVPEYDSGLPTSGTCPQPYQVVTGFGTWEVTFQFACDMASAIRTPLIAISYLMAGFIVVGVRK